jgi:aspartate aminotransferase
MTMYREVEQSQTLLINTQSKQLESQNKKIYKFGFGQSPFLPPKKVIKSLKKAARRKDYSSVQGDPELRQYISTFHAKYNGLKSNPDNILVAPGSKILIYNILMSYEAADVMIAAPSWVSYAPQAKLAGHNLIKLKTSFKDRWRISPSHLIEGAKSKKHGPSILIINYPGNPDGLSYTKSELKALAKMVKELNILVISDEIYGLLEHENAHKSFATFCPENTITTSGLSKWCGAGGWRLGLAMLPDSVDPKFKQALIGIGSETYSCAATPVQEAAKTAYGNFKDSMQYVKKQNKVLKLIGNYCADQLSRAGVNVHSPAGGFYLFVDFSPFQKKMRKQGIHSSNELCEKLLLSTGVVLLPASAFGFKKEFLAARLAYVDFEDPSAKESFQLKEDCPKIVEGIQALTQWISSMQKLCKNL